MKSYLFIFSQSPFSNFIAEEAIEAALTFSSFEQKIGILFVNDGVWQIVKNINAEKILRKNFTYVLKTLDLYDIKEEDVFVESESCKKRNLSKPNFIINPQMINCNQIDKLIKSYDVVLNF